MHADDELLKLHTRATTDKRRTDKFCGRKWNILPRSIPVGAEGRGGIAGQAQRAKPSAPRLPPTASAWACAPALWPGKGGRAGPASRDTPHYTFGWSLEVERRHAPIDVSPQRCVLEFGDVGVRFIKWHPHLSPRQPHLSEIGDGGWGRGALPIPIPNSTLGQWCSNCSAFQALLVANTRGRAFPPVLLEHAASTVT